MMRNGGKQANIDEEDCEGRVSVPSAGILFKLKF